MTRNSLCALFLSCACGAGVAAQGTTPPPQTTPRTTPQSTPQNTPTTKSHQVIYSGCVGNAAGNRTGGTVGTASPRYSLSQLQWGTSGAIYDDWVRLHANTSSGTGSTVNAPRPTELALGTARSSTVDLSKYVGQNVELTGTLDPMPSARATGTGTATGRTGTTGGVGTGGTGAAVSPMMTVTGVKVLNTKCGG